MALKPERSYNEVIDISWFMYNTTGEKGGIVSAVTGFIGSGSALDQTTNRCEYATNPSGRVPIGLLLNDVVNNNLSRTPLNWNKSEVQLNDKVAVARKGYYVTNMFAAGGAPTGSAGGYSIPADAFLGPTGTLTTQNLNLAVSVTGSTGATVLYATAYPKVGQFVTRTDGDGYAKVWIDLP